jgi:hypothetical protein
MFEADIRDKLPEIADYEDYLTSCVFGALKYLPPSKGLLPVLATAKNHRLDIGLGDYCERRSIQLTAISEAHYIFWPKCLKPPSKPDLVVILQGGPHSFIVPIEVKYFAGKHGEGEDDQLMRYYQALSTPGARRTCNNPRIQHFSGELLAVVYLTQFSAKHEIEATRRQLALRGLREAQDRVFGLKWRHVYEEIRKLSSSECNLYRKRILMDIRRLLEHKHLTPFVGFSGLPRDLSTQAVRQCPVFFEARQSSAFPKPPSSLSMEVLSRRPVFLQSGNKHD